MMAVEDSLWSFGIGAREFTTENHGWTTCTRWNCSITSTRQFRSSRHAEVDGTWRVYLCKLAQKRQSTIATTAAVDVHRRFARQSRRRRVTAKLRCTHCVLVWRRSMQDSERQARCRNVFLKYELIFPPILIPYVLL